MNCKFKRYDVKNLEIRAGNFREIFLASTDGTNKPPKVEPPQCLTSIPYLLTLGKKLVVSQQSNCNSHVSDFFMRKMAFSKAIR